MAIAQLGGALRHGCGGLADFDDRIDRLIADHRMSLLRFVRGRYRGRSEDAEEIVQDVFVAAARLGFALDRGCAPLTWLCALAKLKICDRVRAQKRRGRGLESFALSIEQRDGNALVRGCHAASVTDALLNRLEIARLIELALDSMTEDQRRAVVLRYVQQSSIAEIAGSMGRSEKAVERLLERGRRRLRESIRLLE